MNFWLPVLEDTVLDGVKILPYLFITYLIMEYLEHRTGNKTQDLVQKAGRFGPLLGGLFGAFPQCGFSAAASNLYAGRVITLGTLIAIYLSTSDEMIPLFISEQVPLSKMVPILIMKAVLGIFYGFLIDLAVRQYRKYKKRAENDPMRIDELCKRENCHCEEDTPKISAHRSKNENAEGKASKPITKAAVQESSHEHHHTEGHGNIFRSALIHTLHIFIYVFIFTFILNGLIEFVGEDSLAGFLQGNTVLSHVLAGIVGLIPNCAASIVITELYISNIISFGAMMSGLLVGAGVGLLILYRVNEGTVRNLQITGILYLIGTFTGLILDLFNFAI